MIAHAPADVANFFCQGIDVGDGGHRFFFGRYDGMPLALVTEASLMLFKALGWPMTLPAEPRHRARRPGNYDTDASLRYDNAYHRWARLHDFTTRSRGATSRALRLRAARTRMALPAYMRFSAWR